MFPGRRLVGKNYHRTDSAGTGQERYGERHNGNVRLVLGLFGLLRCRLAPANLGVKHGYCQEHDQDAASYAKRSHADAEKAQQRFSKHG